MSMATEVWRVEGCRYKGSEVVGWLISYGINAESDGPAEYVALLSGPFGEMTKEQAQAVCDAHNAILSTQAHPHE